jgi:homogentisate 1,2-dioxygenase
MSNDLQHTYIPGFGNHVATEAEQNALPIGRNSPQKAPLGLYAEQLSGTAFTMPRHENKRTWFYRIQPAVVQEPFQVRVQNNFLSAPFTDVPPSPNQMRWSPMAYPTAPTHFIDGIHTIGGNGDAGTQSGVGIHVYVATSSMEDTFFYNADGEMLIVPQEGRLKIFTEMGVLEVAPKEICVIGRGIKFRVELPGGKARGYICENYGALFRIPDLGPIGANGLANPRDFLTPTAHYEERDGDFELIAKFQGNLWNARIDHSPLDVVAWHGNFAPYKYNLEDFNTINTVSFDHPDPSIFTVLTSPTDTHGTANCDFVIFPPRWMVAEDTFRPPWFHRNFMSEFMGLIEGEYDAKAEGFTPGGCSLHNCMSGHGPDAETFEKASNADLQPQYIDKTMAFMFETRFAVRLTKAAAESPLLQDDYYKCWQGLQKHFRK